MMHENAYVASISLSADVNQTVKARVRNARKKTTVLRRFFSDNTREFEDVYYFKTWYESCPWPDYVCI